MGKKESKESEGVRKKPFTQIRKETLEAREREGDQKKRTKKV